MTRKIKDVQKIREKLFDEMDSLREGTSDPARAESVAREAAKELKEIKKQRPGDCTKEEMEDPTVGMTEEKRREIIEEAKDLLWTEPFCESGWPSASGPPTSNRAGTSFDAGIRSPLVPLSVQPMHAPVSNTEAAPIRHL